MTSGTRLTTAAPRPAAAGSPRKRHWLRWIAGAAAAVLVLIVLAAGAFIKLQPTAAPLALPAGPASAPAGALGGTWAVTGGSVAGFRVRETALGLSTDGVGRTSVVTGTVVISADQVTSATVRVDLAAITVAGKTPPQVAASLRTRQYPEATFTLTGPVELSQAFTSGSTLWFTATGQLAVNGSVRQVTASISARRDGTTLWLAGSIPVTFSTWGIKAPASFGFLASIADHGVAEFLLTLRRA
jgi:polyisoprenoid-binding protein YceI